MYVSPLFPIPETLPNTGLLVQSGQLIDHNRIPQTACPTLSFLYTTPLLVLKESPAWIRSNFHQGMRLLGEARLALCKDECVLNGEIVLERIAPKVARLRSELEAQLLCECTYPLGARRSPICLLDTLCFRCLCNLPRSPRNCTNLGQPATWQCPIAATAVANRLNDRLGFSPAHRVTGPLKSNFLKNDHAFSSTGLSNKRFRSWLTPLRFVITI